MVQHERPPVPPATLAVGQPARAMGACEAANDTQAPPDARCSMKAIGTRLLIWLLLRASRLCLLTAEGAIAASSWPSTRAKRLLAVAGINGWTMGPAASAGPYQASTPWRRS